MTSTEAIIKQIKSPTLFVGSVPVNVKTGSVGVYRQNLFTLCADCGYTREQTINELIAFKLGCIDPEQAFTEGLPLPQIIRALTESVGSTETLRRKMTECYTYGFLMWEKTHMDVGTTKSAQVVFNLCDIFGAKQDPEINEKLKFILKGNNEKQHLAKLGLVSYFEKMEVPLRGVQRAISNMVDEGWVKELINQL